MNKSVAFAFIITVVYLFPIAGESLFCIEAVLANTTPL